jgi:chemotaxis methyl-accepting protein methylase
MDDQQFRRLLTGLNLSWDGYRKVRKGVKKRIGRHMQQLSCRSIEAYMAALAGDSVKRRESEILTAVSISRFFRDRRLWKTIEQEILPGMLNAKADPLKVWSAGCAGGEEIYSFKIIWNRFGERSEDLPTLIILATDIQPTSLDRARQGVYPRSTLREVPDECRSEDFEALKGGKRYAVSNSLKRGIRWQIHDLLCDPPDRGFHIIFLRNSLLTYYRKEIQRKAFPKILGALAPGGFLIIGSHERLPFESPDLAPIAQCSCIYEKK